MRLSHASARLLRCAQRVDPRTSDDARQYGIAELVAWALCDEHRIAPGDDAVAWLNRVLTKPGSSVVHLHLPLRRKHTAHALVTALVRVWKVFMHLCVPQPRRLHQHPSDCAIRGATRLLPADCAPRLRRTILRPAPALRAALPPSARTAAVESILCPPQADEHVVQAFPRRGCVVNSRSIRVMGCVIRGRFVGRRR